MKRTRSIIGESYPGDKNFIIDLLISGMLFQLLAYLKSSNILNREQQKNCEREHDKKIKANCICGMSDLNISFFLLKTISLELLLKIMYMKQMNREIRGHDLHKIFNKLNEYNKTILISEFKKAKRRNSMCIAFFKDKSNLLDTLEKTLTFLSKYMLHGKYGELAENVYTPIDVNFFNNILELIGESTYVSSDKHG